MTSCSRIYQRWSTSPVFVLLWWLTLTSAADLPNSRISPSHDLPDSRLNSDAAAAVLTDPDLTTATTTTNGGSSGRQGSVVAAGGTTPSQHHFVTEQQTIVTSVSKASSSGEQVVGSGPLGMAILNQQVDEKSYHFLHRDP